MTLKMREEGSKRSYGSLVSLREHFVPSTERRDLRREQLVTSSQIDVEVLSSTRIGHTSLDVCKQESSIPAR